MAQLNLQNITLSFGSAPLFECINLQIHKGEKITLLGRNGAGKTTFMKLINGNIEADSGEIIREKGLKTALLTQDVPSDIPGTIYDVIAEGVFGKSKEHHDSLEEQKKLQQIEKTISLLNIDRDIIYKDLSAGMKRKALLGRAIVNEPDILLLDEPTNHLDIEFITWLEEFLLKYEETVFFVTHDREFMQKIADRIIELDRGKIFDWKCGYKTFLTRKEAWLESEETQNSLFDKKLAKEEEWIRKGIKARRTRNEGRVRALKKMREERAMRRELTGTVKMDIQKADASGKMVFEADNVKFSYGENLIIDNFSTRILRGDRLGIIGPNGCGKTTLLKILLGEIEADSGMVKRGARIDAAYFDQMRNRLDEEKTIKENVTDGNEIISFNGKNKHVIGYLQDFLFPPDRVNIKVKLLSGGEKNRLLLAKLFAKPANLLILDEPTNDLDIETIELLEDILIDYEGTILLVSHDRSFLNNVVTGTIAFEGSGRVNEYAGGYDDWLIQAKKDKSGTKKVKKAVKEKTPVEKTKLTFKEANELESLPRVIENKESRVKEIYTIMADPGFYQNKGDSVNEIKRELENLEEEIESLYKRWDYLSSFE
jgi:ATP-binding cassette subfamily F protein uup